MNKVDFNYAFGEPHRITLSRPSASEKTLVTVCKEKIGFMWTWGNLKDKFPLSWTIMPMDVKLELKVFADSEPAAFDCWERVKGGAPVPIVSGKKNGVNYTVSAIAAKGGAVIKVSAYNADTAPHDFCAALTHTNGWVISNKGWIDGINNNVLLTMNDGRSDRFIAVGFGADEYPVPKESGGTISGVPMANIEYFGGSISSYPKSLQSAFKVKPGQTKTGYIYLPYKEYFENIGKMRALDCEKLMIAAKREWDALLAKGTEFTVPDEGVLHCYKSCLADLFVMREKMAEGYTGVAPGTEIYRSPNSGEGILAALIFNQTGYEKEARSDMRVYSDGQDEDGCWASSKAWEHECWGASYFKAMLATERYKLTQDKEYLKEIYKRMKRAALWNGAAREKSRETFDKSSPYYGLMPRGMGDCGMMNGSDYYGVFYPTNCLTVAADGLILEAARILGEERDIPVLEGIYESAKTDLIRSIRNNAKKQDDIVYMPGIAGTDNSSLFGCLYAFYPAKMLSADDPLIRGGVRLFETRKKSEGGLPMGTGWMKEGLWVAMALDNVAAAYLRMGEYDKACAYFYPALNHATPFVTWCEERGAEKASSHTSGDLQHAWTPISVCRFMRDMMVMEKKDRLHIACATPREWLEKGKIIGVKGARTHYGKLDFTIERGNNDTVRISLKAERPVDVPAEIHIRLPAGKYSLHNIQSGCGAAIAGQSVIIAPANLSRGVSIALKIKAE